MADPPRYEPDVAHQILDLQRRPLPTALAGNQHQHIDHRAKTVQMRRFVVQINRDQPRTRRHGGADSLEDVTAGIITPVVQNPLHRVDVSASVQLTEQVASAALDPLGQPSPPQKSVGLLDDLGRIEQDATSVRAMLEDSRQHVPDPPRRHRR